MPKQTLFHRKVMEASDPGGFVAATKEERGDGKGDDE
jgi:hypothetical protein